MAEKWSEQAIFNFKTKFCHGSQKRKEKKIETTEELQFSFVFQSNKREAEASWFFHLMRILHNNREHNKYRRRQMVILVLFLDPLYSIVFPFKSFFKKKEEIMCCVYQY